MLPSQSSLSTDTSLLPICGSSSSFASSRSTGAAGDDAGADFDQLFADLSSPDTGDEEGVPAEAAALLVPLPVEPAPEPVNPALDPTLSSAAGPAPEESAEADATADEAGGWSAASEPWRRRSLASSRERGEAAGDSRPGSWAHPEGPVTRALPSSRRMDNVATAPTSSATLAGAQVGPVESPASSRATSPLPPQLQSLPVESELDPATFLETTAATAGQEALPDDAELSRRGPASGFGIGPDAALRPGAGERPNRTGEKIAGRLEARGRSFATAGEGADKSFLSSEGQEVVNNSRRLGIDVAKSAAAMPATAFNAPPTHSGSEYAVPALAPAAAVTDVAAVEESLESFSTAHEAVEVVLHAVEHVAAREQSSVQLRFSVAGEELAVRVELRADEVRTTFRTDSAELRAALTREWQQVAGGAAPLDRPVRIAPAVFASAEQSAFNASAGDTSSRERQAGTRRQESETAVAGLRGRTVAPVATPPTPSSAATPVRAGGSHRLHTLA